MRLSVTSQYNIEIYKRRIMWFSTPLSTHRIVFETKFRVVGYFTTGEHPIESSKPDWAVILIFYTFF